MSNNVYLCPPLERLFVSQKPIKIAIGGRGTGKSTYLGMELYQCAVEMPKSKGSLTGPTYNQLLTKMLPSMKKKLIELGLKEDVPGTPGHFRIGKKPPAHFQLPHDAPEKWEYVISMFNGACCELISADRPDQARGGSYDFKFWDEAVLAKKKLHDEVEIFTLRGNRRFFAHSPRHGMRVYTSSQAHNSSGFWVEDQKFLRNKKGDILRDKTGAGKLDPDVICEVFSSYANLPILGQRVLDTWKKTSTPMSWDIEVMSKRGAKLPNGFYPSWDGNIHTYMGGAEYDYDDRTEFGIYTKREDTDRSTHLPLLLTFDFNAALNTMIVAQERSGELRLLNEFFAPGQESEDVWLKPFLDYYKNHQEKKIYLYGDPGGNKVAILDNQSTYDKIMRVLKKHGWKVELMVKGKAYPGHRIKQRFINSMLKEDGARFPKIRAHATRTQWTITSIENTPINPDFTKNKASERQDIDQRGATHPSDAVDYLLFYRYYPDEKRQESGHTERAPIRIGSNIL